MFLADENDIADEHSEVNGEDEVEQLEISTVEGTIFSQSFFTLHNIMKHN